jgi:hypothetical protein
MLDSVAYIFMLLARQCLVRYSITLRTPPRRVQPTLQEILYNAVYIFKLLRAISYEVLDNAAYTFRLIDEQNSVGCLRVPLSIIPSL